MKMHNGERSDPEGRTDWPVRIAGGVGAGAALALALFLGPMVGISGFWQGLVAVVVAIAVGGILGQQLGGLLFRRSSGGPDDAASQQ